MPGMTGGWVRLDCGVVLFWACCLGWVGRLGEAWARVSGTGRATQARRVQKVASWWFHVCMPAPFLIAAPCPEWSTLPACQIEKRNNRGHGIRTYFCRLRLRQDN